MLWGSIGIQRKEKPKVDKRRWQLRLVLQREPEICSHIREGSLCEGMGPGEAQRVSGGLMRAEAGKENE